MQRRFFSGDSLAQAINQAAQHFQLAPGEIDYKVIDKRHGFLKVRRKVLIEVDETSPRKEPEAAGARHAEEPSRPAAQPPSEREARPPAEDEWSARQEVGDAHRSEEPGTVSSSASVAGSRPARDEEPLAPAVGESLFDDQELAEDEQLRGDEPRFGEDDAGSSGEATVEPPRERRPRRRRGARSRGEGGRLVELADAPRPAKSRYEEATGEEAEAAREALEKVLKLADLVLENEILQAEEHLLIELRGADQDLLLRDRGRLLLAIQHLLPRLVRGLIGRSVVCKVDSDNYHEIREERLRDMAQRAADEVRHRGRPKTLEPMSPDERRIVHLTLADYPGVETESHGSGLFKRVMVRSLDRASDRRSQRRDSYRR